MLFGVFFIVLRNISQTHGHELNIFVTVVEANRAYRARAHAHTHTNRHARKHTHTHARIHAHRQTDNLLKRWVHTSRESCRT